jgi:hypothetical protein
MTSSLPRENASKGWLIPEQMRTTEKEVARCLRKPGKIPAGVDGQQNQSVIRRKRMGHPLFKYLQRPLRYPRELMRVLWGMIGDFRASDVPLPCWA